MGNDNTPYNQPHAHVGDHSTEVVMVKQPKAEEAADEQADQPWTDKKLTDWTMRHLTCLLWVVCWSLIIVLLILVAFPAIDVLILGE